jgi:predicted nucleic acid-binding protein
MILDSNIVIYSVMPEYGRVLEYLKQHQDQLYVSAVTKLEVLGYHKLDVEEKELFEGFFRSVSILPITSAIIEQAIRLRQQKKMSLGDSLIASTAIQNKQILLTNNEADFINLPDLIVLPMKTIL